MYRGECQLTEKQKKRIRKMFFGPYNSMSPTVNGVIDNRSETIAKVVKAKYEHVDNYITTIVKEHFELIKEQRNLGIQPRPINP